jgi:hypothetical protein
MRRLITALALLIGLSHAASADNPHVTLETEMGDIVIEVMIDKAPLSGGDFLTYVEKGLFHGEGFYRIVRAVDNDNGAPSLWPGHKWNGRVRSIHSVPADRFEQGEGYLAGQMLKEPVRIISARID